MKKMSVKNQRGLVQSVFSFIGAILGPLIGWQISGWTSLDYYLSHNPGGVFTWLAVGCLIGLVVGVVIAREAVPGESDKDNK